MFRKRFQRYLAQAWAVCVFFTMSVCVDAALGISQEGASAPIEWEKLSDLPLEEREKHIAALVMQKRLSKSFVHRSPITRSHIIDGTSFEITYFVSQDVFSLGEGEQQLRVPLTPNMASYLAKQHDCFLPTRQMANEIYAAAEFKLAPSPMPPSDSMTRLSAFVEHHRTIEKNRPQGSSDENVATSSEPESSDKSTRNGIIAGHKKDVVLSSATPPGRVAIYGWHRSETDPIQPLFTKHFESWVDYSHGVRWIERQVLINGTPYDAKSVLTDPKLCALLSDEGPIDLDQYCADRIQFRGGNNGVRIAICSPLNPHHEMDAEPGARSGPRKASQLVLYALPNGNTLEETLGRRVCGPSDWRYGIQNIRLQAETLRTYPDWEDTQVILLESKEKSWPTWVKNSIDPLASVGFMDQLVSEFCDRDTQLHLLSHSGGGALIFDYIQKKENLPTELERIAFLDSNYAFNKTLHQSHLEDWFADQKKNRLVVIAYKDYIARLEGKPFVSEEGGTWGRSMAMRDSFSRTRNWTITRDDDLEHIVSPENQIHFWLHHNSNAKILHTVLVEKNGFLHALLCGSEFENEGYTFMGDRAY